MATPDNPIPTLSAGRAVHFVPSASTCRGAIIIRTWPGEDTEVVALAAFMDGPRDMPQAGPDGLPYTAIWQSAVPHDPSGKTIRSWHYIEECHVTPSTCQNTEMIDGH